jgi:hypothetical protein
MSENLTADGLRERLHYAKDTGVWTRLRGGKGARIGDVAGHTNVSGYREISVAGRVYKEHRLAYLYMTGEWPKHQIDHINGDPSDNRWLNLREATASKNQANSWGANGQWKGAERVRGKWRARIKVNGKDRHLGMFDTRANAALAHATAACGYSVSLRSRSGGMCSQTCVRRH